LTLSSSLRRLKCMRFLFKWPLLIAVSLSFGFQSHGQANSTYMGAPDPGKEFIMSCTYGVLAGTLIGAATLAFVDKPSDNLNKVARGASLGLYAGILLGAYVVYVVPGMQGDPYEEDPLISSQFLLYPTLSDLGHFDGAQFQYQVMSF